MKIFYTIVFSICMLASTAQDSTKIFTKVQKEAFYPGGQIEWVKFLGRTIHYPNEAANANKIFEVNVIFIVDNTGKVSDIKTTGGTENGDIKEEAIRIIQASGIWVPAVQDGINVSSYKKETIVFNFKKPDDKHDPVKKLRGTMDSASFYKLEIESEYPGGKVEWGNFLQRALHYPDYAVKNNIQGTVVVRFIVDKDGSVSDIHAISGPEFGGLREAAESVVRRSGKWMPAFQYGRYVKSYKNQPFIFSLSN